MAVTCTTANATEIGLQADQTIVPHWLDAQHPMQLAQNRDRALAQFKDMGGTNVRINVRHVPGPAASTAEHGGTEVEPLSNYDDAIVAIRAAGLTPQLTLLWYDQADPDTIAAWMGAMARHFGPVVGRYSVLNEPDLTLQAADACDSETIKQLIAEGTLEVTHVTKRVKHYLRRRVTVRKHGKVYKRWRYLYKKVRIAAASGKKSRFKWRRVRRYRWTLRSVAVAKSGTVDSIHDSVSIKQGCRAIIRGRIYRQIFLAAEPAIRQADPGTQVLAGETSPRPGLDLFISQVLPLHADGWAHHPYQFDTTPEVGLGGYGIGDLGRMAALVQMPLYLTEFGYPRPGTPFVSTIQQKYGVLYSNDLVDALLPRAWHVARVNGVMEMTQYYWFRPFAGWLGEWDTSILNDDGAVTPAYDALRTEALSW